MNTLLVIVLVVVGWLVIAVPVGMCIGRMVRAAEEREEREDPPR